MTAVIRPSAHGPSGSRPRRRKLSVQLQGGPTSGPHAPPPGRRGRCGLGRPGGHAQCPAAGANTRNVLGSRGGGSAGHRRGAAGRGGAGRSRVTRGLVAAHGPPAGAGAGCRLRLELPPAGALWLRDGQDPRAGRGPWVVARDHPACRRPGRAEQTTARPASVRMCVKVRLTWRAGRRPAPLWAGRRQTGWRVGWCCCLVGRFAGRWW